MKIILVSSSAELVGVSKHVLNLAHLLLKDNKLDIVVCPQAGWLSDQLSKEGLPYIVLDISYKPIYFIISSIKMLMFIRTRSANILHLHGRFPLLISIMTMCTCRRLMFVATVHQFSDTGLHGIWHWKQKLENFLLRRCDGIICVSKSLRNDIISQLGEDHSNKVKLIYNWIDSNKSNSCREHGFEWDDFDKLQRKDICICGIGRLSYEKGFDILISAIAFVRGQGYTIKCDIFGEGPEKISLKKMIDSNGLSESVNLKGVSDQIDKILPQYYALAIPSRRESFGLVALEAYQAGIPVIASDIPGLQEVVVNGKTGVLFEEGNVRSLANALLCIINNDEHGEYLVQNAAVFLKNFLPNCTLLRKYNQFYNEVLKSKKI